MEPIRYGVVGLGRAGWGIHIAQLRDRTEGKIVAVVDPVKERCEQAEKELGCKSYPNLNAMLKKSDADVIIVATLSAMHAKNTIAALKAGKHVVVEKPMAGTVKECQKMIAAAEAADRKLFVHHNYRFNPEFLYMKQTIASGILGKIFHIRFCSVGFRRRCDWQTLKANAGGVLNNTGSHFIDQGLVFMGAPLKEVFGDLQQIASAGDVEDHVKAFLRAENGCTFDVDISSAQNVAMPLPKWVICGSTGTLTLSPDGATATVRYFDPAKAPKLESIDGAAPNRSYGNDDVLPWQEKVEPSKGTSIGVFYDNVTGVLQRGEPMVITPDSACDVISAIELIRKSSEKKKSIHVSK